MEVNVVDFTVSRHRLARTSSINLVTTRRQQLCQHTYELMSRSKLWRRIVEGKWAENLASSVSIPRDRKLQESLDYERLALYTQLWKATEGGQRQPTPRDYQRMLMQVKAATSKQHHQEVDACVQQQIINTAKLLHEQLAQAGDTLHAARSMQAAYDHLYDTQSDTQVLPDQQLQPSTTDQAATTQPPAQPPHQHSTLSVSEVSALLQQRLGFSTHVGPSSIQHPEAGQGVFVQGTACVGSVVALVPGLFYGPTQLTRMPNYPKVAMDNDYLSSRYDMTILDSKPWLEQQASSSSITQPAHGSPQQAHECAGIEQDVSANTSSLHKPGSTKDYEVSCWALSGLERRHPLAVGHLINHPPEGTLPNVLEVRFDMQLQPHSSPPWLRAYIPLAPGLDLPQDCSHPAEALLAAVEGQERDKQVLVLKGLALVATRTIRDGEELFQNYRLNPKAVRPEWYWSIDEEEERRRWAPLWYANLV